jgi:hypothetical protein
MRKINWLGNKELILSLVVFMTIFLLGMIPTWGATFYVSDSDSLRAALTAAQSTGDPDTIYLQAGSYSTLGTPFAYTASVNDEVRLVGGWNAGFTSQYRGMDPASMTNLDGINTNRIFHILNSLNGVQVKITIENIAFTNGKATDNQGGGLRAFNSNGGKIHLIINRSLFQNNTGTVSYWAGALATFGMTEIYDSIFKNNSAREGGAIGFYKDPATSDANLSPIVDRCTFDNNTNIGYSCAYGTCYDGGSDIYSNVSPLIKNSSFLNTSGQISGGAAFDHSNGGKLTLVNSTISGKKGWFWGGGIHIWNSEADIFNCLFINNSAGNHGTWGRGGGVTIYDPSPDNPAKTVKVYNSTFVKNRSYASALGGSGLYGMAIDNRVQALMVYNSIFWDNGTADQFPIFTSEGGTASVNYSDYQYGWTGSGGSNINLLPDFVDFNNNDFHLNGSSPCRDTGTDMPAGTFLYALYPTSSDRDGRARIIDTVDMGAYEFDTSPYAHAVGRGDPNLAHDPVNNRYLAVYNNTDGSGGGRLYGRLVNPDGTPFAAEFPISEQMSYKRMFSAAAYDAYHNKFVTIWDIFNASSNDMDIQGQLVNPDGSLDGWNYVVSNKVGVEEFTPAIAYDETTYNTLVAWTKHTFPDEYDVYGRLFLQDVPQGPDEFAIANPAGSGQGNPAIAFDGNNDQFLVVWTDDRDSGTSQSEVYGQRIAASGALSGGNFRITDNRPGDQGPAAVAFSPDTGKFLVAWAEDLSGSSDLYGRVVDGAGTLPGSIFPISLSGGEQSDVSLAFDSQKNRFLAVWQDTRNNPTTGTDLYGQLFDTHGNPTWPNFAIVRAANEQRYPKAASGSGSFLVAYEYSDLTGFDVRFRQITDPGFLFLPLILK